jgi:Co/Zn/Cd efflux system component
MSPPGPRVVSAKLIRSILPVGYARAEILAAFGNAIFLLALCFSIFLEAIQRFIDVQGKWF